jgi:hypothetical protein
MLVTLTFLVYYSLLLERERVLVVVGGALKTLTLVLVSFDVIIVNESAKTF